MNNTTSKTFTSRSFILTLLTLLISFNLTTVRAEQKYFNYVDASGFLKSAYGYYFDSADDFPADLPVNALPGGWYYFSSNYGNIDYAVGTIRFTDPANIIIEDGAHLIASVIKGPSLTFYNSFNGAGTVTSELDASDITIYAGTFDANDVSSNNLILYGGTLKVTNTLTPNVTLYGGTLEVTNTLTGNVTLSGGTINASRYDNSVTIADGLVYTYEVGNNVFYLTGTITDTNAISGKTLSLYDYTYLDENGHSNYIPKEDITIFNSAEDINNAMDAEGKLPGGWYFVKGEIDYYQDIIFADDANANFIIESGAHLNANHIESKDSLTFYASPHGAGTVESGLQAPNITIYAGTFIATDVSTYYNLKLYAGTLEVTNVLTSNVILYGGTIKASRYEGTVTIADGLVYSYEDDNDVIYLTGTIDDLNAIKKKTLSFYGYDYLDEHGQTNYIAKEDITIFNTADDINKAKDAEGKLPGGWYLFKGEIQYNDMVEFSGDANIIIDNDAHLIATFIEGPSLTFYDSPNGAGTVESDLQATNNITIYAGTFNVSCVYSSNLKLFGGKLEVESTLTGNVTLYGGTIKATSYDGSVTIGDGLVYAYFDEQFNYHYLCSVIDDCKSLEGKTLFLVNDQSPVNIADCNINMPNQSKVVDSNIGDKFAASTIPDNDNVGAIVKNGTHPLTLGTDYRFGEVVFANDQASCTVRPNNLFDEFLVEVKGIGLYYGTQWVPFTLVANDIDGIYADCIHWYFHNGTLSIYKESGIDGDIAMPVADEDATDGCYYPWYDVASSISKVQIAYGITSIAKHAFDGSVTYPETSHAYARLKEVNLPTTITHIDEYAFANCDVLYIDLNKLPENVNIHEMAFYQTGCVAGELMDNLSDGESNTTNLGFMLNAATADVTLKGRTLYKDGDWNTLCLPFGIGDDNAEDGHAYDNTPLEGAIVKTLVTGTVESSSFNTSTGVLNLIFDDAKSVPAGTPCIVRWEKEPGYVNDGTCDINDPIFKGVKVTSDEPTEVTFDGGSFVGQYNNFAITDANIDEIILLCADNTIGYAGEPRNLRPFRAHFSVPAPNDGGQAVKRYSISFGEAGEATGIVDIPAEPSTKDGGSGYFSIDGRRLPAKPVSKGVYIHNGYKFLIK